MQSILKKLFLGNLSKVEKPEYNPVQNASKNIKAIWNNNHQNDNGIEKMVRLFLSSSQLLFRSLHQIFGVFDRIRISGLGFGFLCADESYISSIDIDLRLAKLSLCHLDNDLCIA